MNRTLVLTWLRRAASLLPLLLAVWAFQHSLEFARAFGLPVPCSDGWSYVELHERYNAHTLRFADLFAMHNEHLFFLPRVLFVAIGAITHVNLMAQLLLSHVELLLTLLLVWLVVARQFGRRWFELPWWFAPVPFLVFSLAQWRNLLCTFQSGFITAVPLSIGAYYFLTRFCRLSTIDGGAWRRGAWFGLAVLCALAASFSTAQGLAAWPAGGLLLLLCCDKPLHRSYLAYLAGWALSMIGACATFAHYYRASTGHSHEVGKVAADFSGIFGRLLSFALSLLGSPFAGSLEESIVGGSVVLAVFAACAFGLWRARRLRENAFHMACALQVFGTVAMIAVGRIHLGDDYSQQSRYVTLIVPLWVATVCLAASLTQPSRRAASNATRVWPGALLGAALCFTVLAAATAWRVGPTVGAQKLSEQEKLVRKLIRGRGADHVYVKRWRELGVKIE
jgi:hypothetical protein